MKGFRLTRLPLYQYLTHLVLEETGVNGIKSGKELLYLPVFVDPSGNGIQGKEFIFQLIGSKDPIADRRRG